MDAEQLKSIGQGGVFVALITLIYFVGMRLIAAVDRLGTDVRGELGQMRTKLDDHTRLDLEHHSDVKEAIVRVESKIDTIADLTPVKGIRREPEDVSSGYYPSHRPKTQGGR